MFGLPLVGSLGWAAAGLAAAIAMAVIAQGLLALRGSAATQKVRKREGRTAERWLGEFCTQQLGLEGLRIKCKSAAAVDEWMCNHPPPLSRKGPSYLWGLLPQWIFPDIVVRPAPVKINATPREVWDVLIDFDRYNEWNPFHRKIEIVEVGDDVSNKHIAVRMTVDMGPILGRIVSVEKICYVDSKRHMLMYSAEHPSALRMIWLAASDGGSSTIFNSFDMIGGYPALFSRGHIVGVVHRGFTAQHEALRDAVHRGTLRR